MGSHNTPYHMYQGPLMQDDPGDAGTIVIDRFGAVVPMVSAAAETRTLAVPTKAGILATLVMDTDGGDITLTVTSGYNFDADTSITFDDAGDYVTFVSVKIGANYRWRAIAQEGTTAATEEGTFDTATITTGTITDLTATSLKLGVTAVNAAGGAIGNSGALAAGLNVVAAADNTLSVILPVAETGMVVLVRSTVNSKTLPVFPQVNSQINALGANSAMTLYQSAVGAAAIFVASSATLWHSFEAEDGS